MNQLNIEYIRTLHSSFRIYIRDIRTLFKQGDRYYKPIRVGNFWNSIYIEYKTSGDRNKNLSVKE